MSRRGWAGICGVVLAVALMGVGAWGSASASAAACNVKKTKWVLCTGGNEVVLAPVLGTNEGMVLSGKIGGLNVEIKCTMKGSFKESIWEMSEFTVKFVFNNCLVEKPAGTCVVKNKTIITEPLPGVLEKPGAALEVQFISLPTFAEITIEKCAIEGKYKITGQQKCEVVGEFAKEAAQHEIDCKVAGSKLVLAGTPATLALKATIELMGVAKYNMEQN